MSDVSCFPMLCLESTHWAVSWRTVQTTSTEPADDELRAAAKLLLSDPDRPDWAMLIPIPGNFLETDRPLAVVVVDSTAPDCIERWKRRVSAL